MAVFYKPSKEVYILACDCNFEVSIDLLPEYLFFSIFIRKYGVSVKSVKGRISWRCKVLRKLQTPKKHKEKYNQLLHSKGRIRYDFEVSRLWLVGWRSGLYYNFIVRLFYFSVSNGRKRCFLEWLGKEWFMGVIIFVPWWSKNGNNALLVQPGWYVLRIVCVPQ